MYYSSWIQIYLLEAEPKMLLAPAQCRQPSQHGHANYVSCAQENEQPPQTNSNAMQNSSSCRTEGRNTKTTGYDYLSRTTTKAESSFRHYGF
jgi:hypothetical protein